MPAWTHPPTGCVIAYDDRGGGPPLVLVHAFPQDRRMWEPQEDTLAKVCRLLTPDVFGCGESGLPGGGWTVDAMADALADWLTALGITEPVLFGGLSMGGYVALAFARRHRERVRGLILADTRADADGDKARANRAKAIELVEKESPAALIEQMLPKMLTEGTRRDRPEVVAGVKSRAAAQSKAGVVAALRALRDRPDSTAALADFQFPVLVLVGADDATTPPKLSEAMRDRLTDAKLMVLPGAAHLSNLDAPQAFTDAVLGWVGQFLASGGRQPPGAER